MPADLAEDAVGRYLDGEPPRLIAVVLGVPASRVLPAVAGAWCFAVKERGPEGGPGPPLGGSGAGAPDGRGTGREAWQGTGARAEGAGPRAECGRGVPGRRSPRRWIWASGGYMGCCASVGARRYRKLIRSTQGESREAYAGSHVPTGQANGTDGGATRSMRVTFKACQLKQRGLKQPSGPFLYLACS